MSYAMLLTTAQNAQTVLPDTHLNLPAGTFAHVVQFIRHLKLKFQR